MTASTHETPYTPTLDDIRQHWSATYGSAFDPLAQDDQRLKQLRFDAAIAAHDAKVAAGAWDEACMALAWALDNGPTGDCAAYVSSNNPYKAKESQ